MDSRHNWLVASSLSSKLNLGDPLDDKMVRAERVLREHDVHCTPDYDAVLHEIVLLALMHDRVEAALWALQNLTVMPSRLAELSEAKLLSSAARHRGQVAVALEPGTFAHHLMGR